MIRINDKDKDNEFDLFWCGYVIGIWCVRSICKVMLWRFMGKDLIF